MSARIAEHAREWPIYTADAFAAGLDLYVDDSTANDFQNAVEAAMDRRAEG